MDRHYVNPYLDSEDSVVPDVRAFPELIQPQAKRLLDDLERKLAKETKPKHPDVSIYTGSMGIAYLYWKLYTLGVEDRDRYLEKAARLIDVHYPQLQEKRMSFLAGDAGLLALGIAICNSAGKREMRTKLLAKLIQLSNLALDQADPSTPNELLYGRAGYLYALLFVNTVSTLIEASLITRVINVILEEGQRAQLEYLHYEWHEKCYLGAAHGIYGIMYVLLRARIYLTTENLALIRKTMNWLLQHRFPSGNVPSSLGSKEDRLIHWCHGAPGALYTYLEAHKVFGDKEYLSAAYSLADCVWRRGLLKKGYGLCHGVSGNAYALMSFYHYTKEPRYLKRAYAFAQWCFDYGKMCDKAPDRPLSLFEGQAGAVCMLSDFGWNTTPKFPCFQL